MRVLIISGPTCTLADKLIADGHSLLCVTPDDVYCRNELEGIKSGVNIDCPKKISINLPKIKSALQAGYPLIDRWVSNRQSMSTTIGILLEYTVSLIQIIGNHSTQVAILETGAPHHLFTYCLDVALNYLNVKVYYLYGNAVDGRCLVLNGIKKNEVINISNYLAYEAVDNYIKKIKGSSLYTPDDSTKSISPFSHRSIIYAVYLCIRHSISRYRRNMLRSKSSDLLRIKLELPFLNLFEIISIFYEQKKYIKLLKNNKFDLSQINSGDIVYVGHMLPEATSFPDSPYYPDEVDVLIDLKNRFPDSKIYYREHPAIEIFTEYKHIHFQGLHKNQQFYQQLERLGIDVVPHTLHISKLRNKECLFATKTGRVAIENSILGIPTIVYGYPFYGIDLPLTYHVSRLPLQVTPTNIYLLAKLTNEPTLAVKNYLAEMFSGSIENPGIGMEGLASTVPLFESHIGVLLKYISNH